MKVLQILLVAITVIGFSGCGDDDYPASFKNDMDQGVAWTDNPPPHIIQSPDARSGRYICKLDASNAFGPTFNMHVKDITDKKYGKVKISVWMKAKETNAEPQLVLDIRREDGSTIEWLSQKFTGSALKTDKWGYYENKIDLTKSDRKNPDNIYRIYVSNGKETPVFIDDMRIDFY